MTQAKESFRARRTLVLVTLNMAGKQPVGCFEHEVPLLKMVHGDSKVQTIDDEASREDARAGEIVELATAEERARLTDRYGIDPAEGKPYVDILYGIPQKCTLAQDADVGTDDDGSGASGGPGDSEQQGTLEERIDQKMTKDQVEQALTDAEIDYDGRSNKDKLVQLLADHIRAEEQPLEAFLPE